MTPRYPKRPSPETVVVDRSRWNEMPIQPTAGHWQRRFRAWTAVLLSTLAVYVLIAFMNTGRHRNLVLVWSVYAVLAIECLVMLLIIGISTRVRRKEYAEGYTTWPTAAYVKRQ